MKTFSFSRKLSTLAVAAAVSLSPMMLPTAAQADLSGNIGVHSKYLLRGIGVENDATAVQGGIDYSHDSGFYAGWWGSNLGYTYDRNVGMEDGDGFENDFYAGFAGGADDGFNYKVGLIQYYYISVDDSDLTEFLASVGYGPVSLQAQYLLNDGWWGNDGDIYWTLNYSADLPSDFSLGASLGWYTYDDSDNSKLCYPAGAGCGATTEDSGFRHLNLTLSHPIAETGADMYVQYTVAGEDRGGNDYDNKVVFGLTYGFDI
jgi:uncharacterized protein (TIGR02001 family)